MAREFPDGELATDAAFMQGESALKQEDYKRAVTHYERAAELIAASDELGWPRAREGRPRRLR